MSTVNEARACMKCGRTEVGWRYSRCPNCGEMDENPLSTDESLDAKVQEIQRQLLVSQRFAEAQRILKEQNIQRWVDAQERLAAIERELIRVTGYEGSISDNIAALALQVTALREILRCALAGEPWVDKAKAASFGATNPSGSQKEEGKP